MNCNRMKPRYRYSSTVLTIGVAVFPNGNALPPLEIPGVPTSDIITLVVSQKEAVMVVSNRLTLQRMMDNLPRENHDRNTEKML